MQIVFPLLVGLFSKWKSGNIKLVNTDPARSNPEPKTDSQTSRMDNKNIFCAFVDFKKHLTRSTVSHSEIIGTKKGQLVKPAF